nr:MAG TPA: hypothetical protein [Caudoviricetes sp.]
MKKEAKYQSPASVAMAAAVLEVIGKGENQSMETLKKDVADAFSLINRAFAAYQESLEKDQETKDETPADSQNNESEKPEGNGQTLKIDKEKLDACTEDVHRAFLAYNLYAVILAKHGEINLTSKHLVKAAKRIARACMKDIEGLNLDNMKVRITRVKGKGGELNLKIYPDANYEV